MNENHHWGWIFVAILALAGITYIFTLNRPQIDNYANGSKHVEVTENNYPLSLHPCGAIFKIDGEDQKVNKNVKSLTNSVAK